MLWVFCVYVFNVMRYLFVRFVNNDGTVDHHCLNIFFIISHKLTSWYNTVYFSSLSVFIIID